MKLHHPQQASDEIYLGKTTEAFFNQSLWETKRMGDDDGVLKPWFVSRKEVRARIKEEKEDDEAVQILTRMIKEGTSQF